MPATFRIKPQALERSESTIASKRFDEGTIIWGSHDSTPLEIIKAVSESPVTTSCLNIKADFIKGAGFSNKTLEGLVINKNGQTLLELHYQLADICAYLDGFAVNHKFNSEGRITNAYYIAIENLRFVKPKHDSDPDIKFVKYNPFWGTTEFKQEFTRTYPLHDLDNVTDYMKEMKKDFPGQVYYFGTTSPIYRFYPMPKYWSGEKWIKADGKLQDFHNENLENGFFQSVLLNVIGNPSDYSTNPKYQETYTGEDGVKHTRSTKTVGEEFNEMMSESFSGARKAGTAMVLWSQNADSSAKIQQFPTNTNADLLQGTFTDIIRGITIATSTPAILANLPQQVSSLGSDGDSFKKAVEMMQARTAYFRSQLEIYYNNVLLPNLETPIEERVKIINYSPTSMEVEINDKVWEWMNDQEKSEYVKSNFSNIKLFRQEIAPAPVAPTPVVDPVTGEPQPVQSGNEALKNLKISDINKIQKIVSRYNLSKVDPTNTKGLTYEQAKQMLSSFGFTEEELNAWLVTPEEE
jgi:hypothetical protein